MKRLSSSVAALAVLGAAGTLMPGAQVWPASETSVKAITKSTQQTNGQTPAGASKAQADAWNRWWARHRCTSRRRPGPGWSNRHVQRMARKRRNQARHKRAVRGGR